MSPRSLFCEYARIAGSMRKHGRLFGPFRGLRFLLLDRFGFVANRPGIRSASVWPSELFGPVLFVILTPTFNRLIRVSEQSNQF